MAQNVSLFGTDYASVPSIILPKTGGGSASFVDVTDTTAVAADVVSGKYFYASNGTRTQGAYQPTISPFAIRPDAEIVQSFSSDQMLVADMGVEIPAYSTTANTLVASQDMSPITVDLDDYHYYIAERFLVIPEYSVTTKAKGRVEYSFSSHLYELMEIPANTFYALVDGKKLASRNTLLAPCGADRELYWSSSTAIAFYPSNTYGISEIVAPPTLSGSSLTIKTPSVRIRGSTTYLTSTFYNALTDVRVQYVIDVYRAPKNNLNKDGWGTTQQMMHIADCIENNNQTLT